MANDFSGYTPTMFAQEMIPLLRQVPGAVGRTRVETVQQNALKGGDTVTIRKFPAALNATNVSYASAATSQDINFDTVPLTFTSHKEVKVQANELEERYAEGGWDAIVRDVIPNMVDTLVTAVDQSLLALYASASDTIGTYGAALTDAVVRQGLAKLQTNKVRDMANVHFIVSPDGYTNDLLGVDRLSLANNRGTPGPMSTANLFNPYGFNFDWATDLTTNDGTASTAHGLMFHRDAITVGYLAFNPANSKFVDESIMQDPVTGVVLRVQQYYTPELRTDFMQVDVRWGVAVCNADTLLEVKH